MDLLSREKGSCLGRLLRRTLGPQRIILDPTSCNDNNHDNNGCDIRRNHDNDYYAGWVAERDSYDREWNGYAV